MTNRSNETAILTTTIVLQAWDTTTCLDLPFAANCSYTTTPN